MEENKEIKKMSKTKQYIILGVALLVMVVALLWCGKRIYWKVMADPDGFAVKMNEICDHYHLEYISYENEIYKFSVNDTIWQKGSYINKVAFCNNVHKAIRTALDMYYIQEESDFLFIKLYGKVPDSSFGFGCVASVSNASVDIYY